MRKTSFLITAATAAVLLSAPLAQAQIIGGSGGAAGGLTSQTGGSVTGSGQINPDTESLASRLQSTTGRTRDASGRTVKKGRSAADAVVGSSSDTAGSASLNASGAANAAGDGSVGVSGSTSRDGASVNAGASVETKPRN